MRSDKFRVMILGTFVACFFLFSLVYTGMSFFGNVTGFVVFTHSNQAGFDNGVYNYTIYNGTAVVLSGSNLSGNYVSEIIDAGDDSTWNNLTFVGSEPSAKFIFAVDGAGGVYSSVNLSDWELKKDNYGRTSDTEEMFSDGSYFYIISNSNREIWRSVDGISWSVVNNSFANSGLLLAEADSSGNLYVADASGDVYLSTDSGVSWILKGDFNGGATNNGKGMGITSSGTIFVIDGNKQLFSSLNSGVDWSEITHDYTGSGAGLDDLEIDSSGNLFILDAKDVWKSTNSGVNWVKINDSFTSYSNDGLVLFIDSNDIFYIADATGRIFNSSDSGITWFEQGDFSPGTSDPKGIVEFNQLTNLTWSFQNCSLANCGDGSWQNLDLNNLNLTGRYFQYKVEFSSPDISATPFVNSISVDYTLTNQLPTISLVNPKDSVTYGDNTSIALDYNALDADNDIDSCWYNLDSGANVSLSGCTNITFATSEGAHALNIYVNDSFGEIASDSVSFNVQVGAPTIILGSPIDYYSPSEEITFTYQPTDVDLSVCELWGNFSGTFEKNQTDLSPSSGVDNTFSLNLSDEGYFWNVWCNDTVGNSAFDGNKTFFVDTLNPFLTISEPKGAKTSRTGVPITYGVIDASPISCIYNVTWSTGGEVIADTLISDCSSGTFDLAADGSYILYMRVNDSAGNSNSSSSSFSVSTASTGGSTSTGGGGGGGGTSHFKTNTGLNFEISEVSAILSLGEDKPLQISVTNKGVLSENKCKLVASEGYEKYLDSSELKNVGGGELVEFSFVLNAVDEGVRNLGLSIECLDNKSMEIPLSISILRPKLDVSIEDMEFKPGNILYIEYSVDSTTDSEETIFFKILDSSGSVVAEVSTNAKLKAGVVFEGEVEVDLSEVEGGMLKVSVSGKDGTPYIEETVIYEGLSGLTGFVSSKFSGTGSAIGIISILFFVAVFFLARRIWKLKKK